MLETQAEGEHALLSEANRIPVEQISDVSVILYEQCDRILPRCTSCAELDVECVARSQDIESLLSDDSGLTHASLRR
jgi:hypothetical protein